MATGYAAISETMADLAREGCDPVKLAEIEARLVVLLSRAKTLQRAERALYELGALAAAEREHCHRSTVYRRAEKSRKLAHVATP